MKIYIWFINWSFFIKILRIINIFKFDHINIYRVGRRFGPNILWRRSSFSCWHSLCVRTSWTRPLNLVRRSVCLFSSRKSICFFVYLLTCSETEIKNSIKIGFLTLDIYKNLLKIYNNYYHFLKFPKFKTIYQFSFFINFKSNFNEYLF